MNTALLELQLSIATIRTQMLKMRKVMNDLASLRKQLVFCCHPDRGGHPDLMVKLNNLFDRMEELR